jgi:nucleoid-associated protein YgaU
MTIKSKFTEQEWQLIKDGPEWVFAALAAADGNVAIMTKTKEAKAFKDVLNKYSKTNPLISEVREDKTKFSKEIKNATLSDAEQALQKINQILDAKLSRSEADQYRAFLASVADSVAEAAGEGAFGAGKKISKKEQGAIDKIKEALKPAVTAKVEAKPAPKVEAKPAPKVEAKPAPKVEAKPTPKVEAPKAAKPSEKPAPKPTPKPASQQAVRPSAKPRAEAEKPSPAAHPRPLASAPAIPAQAPVKKEEYLAEHTVASGETLSHISLKYYGSAVKAKYMLIYEANKDVIGDNPNLIKPGMVLNIPKLEE